MSSRIERVIDRYAFSCAQFFVSADYRIASAVSENEIVFWNQREEWIVGVAMHSIERCRRVDVPEHRPGTGFPQLDHRALEQIVKNADAAGLDDHIAAARRFNHRERIALALSRIDYDLRPIRIGYVSVLLPLVCVGLVKSDLMASFAQRSNDAAIVSSRAVPVRRDKARSEKADVQSCFHIYLCRGCRSD